MNIEVKPNASDRLAAIDAGLAERCRLLFCDQLNLARGKYVPMDQARKGHARFCVGSYAVTYDKQLVAAPGGGMLDGLPDMELRFDPADLRTGWEANTQIVLGNLFAEEQPFPLCGRTALQNAVNGWREHGLEPMVGVEMEAFVFQRGDNGGWVPYDTPGSFVYGTGPFTDPAGLVDDIWAMAAKCNLPVESMNAEYDSPQFELTMKYADALTAADNAFLFRQMARELLYKRGYLLSFLPKPFANKGGSGLHHNLSFQDKSGNNIFAADVESGDYGKVMSGSIAGLLKHHRALAAINAPITNSYQRLQPASLSGYWANWGVDHRSVTVRVSGEKGQAARIEHRLGDCAASPYFAMASMLEAARLGVEGGYDLPLAETSDGLETVNTDVHAPESLGEALVALTQDEALVGAVGPEMIANFVAIKQQELETLADKSAEEQLAYYLPFI